MLPIFPSLCLGASWSSADSSTALSQLEDQTDQTVYNCGIRICINCVHLQHLHVNYINTSNDSLGLIKVLHGSRLIITPSSRASQMWGRAFARRLAFFPCRWKKVIYLAALFAFAWHEMCRLIPWQAGLLSVPACYRDPVLVLLEALVQLWPSHTSATLVIRWLILVPGCTWHLVSKLSLTPESHRHIMSHQSSKIPSSSENVLSHPGPCGSH